MAFWDELKEKITQGGQEAIQKTRDIAEVVSTNAGISDSKRKINELYMELGEILVREAFDGMTSDDIAAVLDDETADDAAHPVVLRNWREIYSKVRFIRSEEEVIAMSEAKINELKAEGKCPSCGARIPKGVSFCPECGTRLIPTAAAAMQAETPDPGQPEAPAAAPDNHMDPMDSGNMYPPEDDPQDSGFTE